MDNSNLFGNLATKWGRIQETQLQIHQSWNQNDVMEISFFMEFRFLVQPRRTNIELHETMEAVRGNNESGYHKSQINHQRSTRAFEE